MIQFMWLLLPAIKYNDVKVLALKEFQFNQTITYFLFYIKLVWQKGQVLQSRKEVTITDFQYKERLNHCLLLTPFPQLFIPTDLEKWGGGK